MGLWCESEGLSAVVVSRDTKVTSVAMCDSFSLTCYTVLTKTVLG
jgi:hypothetical protein